MTVVEDPADRALAEVVAGLEASPRRIPSKYFYDARGSELFEEITRLPEYYPTRCEVEILERHAPEMAACIGDDAVLIELGIGSSRKARLLLEHLPRLSAYVPVDISSSALERAAAEIRAAFPDLRVHPVRADFSRPLSVPGLGEATRRVLYYPGSTIGNLDPEPAASFLERLRRAHLHPGDGLLLGADLDKDPAVLRAAYDDPGGVTAAFNKNVLHHLNRLLGADFDPDAFQHVARYDAERGRVEMHLRATATQVVTIGEHRYTFAEGELLHTESSWKYTRASLTRLAERAGYVEERFWTDARGWFGVWFFVAR